MQTWPGPRPSLRAPAAPVRPHGGLPSPPVSRSRCSGSSPGKAGSSAPALRARETPRTHPPPAGSRSKSPSTRRISCGNGTKTTPRSWRSPSPGSPRSREATGLPPISLFTNPAESCINIWTHTNRRQRDAGGATLLEERRFHESEQKLWETMSKRASLRLALAGRST